MKYVIVDTDCGSDDAVALLILLNAEQKMDIKVVGITCVSGNTSVDNVCRNIIVLLETVGKQDIPVFRGAEEALISTENRDISPFHGKNGFGDLVFPTRGTKIQEENAVVAINRLVTHYENVNIICLGPLTNIALALRTYPNIKKHISQLHVMGGNIKGIGNTTSAAEFNFYFDPEAAHIVLSSASVKIVLLPWEPCIPEKITKEWRFSVLGASSTPHMKLINAVEKKIYNESCPCWNPCDAYLAAAFINPNIIVRSRSVHIVVELHGTYTRGQTCVDHLIQKKCNVEAIEEINFDLFKQIMIDVANASF